MFKTRHIHSTINYVLRCVYIQTESCTDKLFFLLNDNFALHFGDCFCVTKTQICITNCEVKQEFEPHYVVGVDRPTHF